MTLPHDYAERVYAGVLGKIIGVYLGRPFEGWTYERILEELGDPWLSRMMILPALSLFCALCQTMGIRLI